MKAYNFFLQLEPGMPIFINFLPAVEWLKTIWRTPHLEVINQQVCVTYNVDTRYRYVLLIM